MAQDNRLYTISCTAAFPTPANPICSNLDIYEHSGGARTQRLILYGTTLTVPNRTRDPGMIVHLHKHYTLNKFYKPPSASKNPVSLNASFQSIRITDNVSTTSTPSNASIVSVSSTDTRSRIVVTFTNSDKPVKLSLAVTGCS